ncbi:hypothetical protein EVAR_10746_1 [Eumeta japonica]|uniref:Uncharacterized protein n=1 Tax=Eumeta variegata TaxID=151549 RepID=A0A4C1W606_EUMVA|nr:hypothetical protein EVAR_10746_1 [Eumeta japonica]
MKIMPRKSDRSEQTSLTLNETGSHPVGTDSKGNDRPGYLASINVGNRDAKSANGGDRTDVHQQGSCMKIVMNRTIGRVTRAPPPSPSPSRQLSVIYRRSCSRAFIGHLTTFLSTFERPVTLTSLRQ